MAVQGSRYLVDELVDGREPGINEP
jgi:hypothetical protein